jgi:hypothetical protein
VQEEAEPVFGGNAIGTWLQKTALTAKKASAPALIVKSLRQLWQNQSDLPPTVREKS